MLIAIYIFMLAAGLLVAVNAGAIAKKVNKNKRIYEVLQKLNAKERVDKEEIEYFRQKILLVSLIVMMSGLFGVGYCYTSSPDGKKIETLVRPSYGEGIKKYNLLVKRKNGKILGKANIELEERGYTEEEAAVICEAAYEKLIPILLNGNESFREIKKDMIFPNYIEGYEVEFEYVPDENFYISYEGKIDFERVDFLDGKFETNIYVICRLGGYETQYVLELIILEPTKSEAFLQSEIQSEIDRNSINSKEINLPEKIEGYEVNYYIGKEDKLWIFIPIGFLLAFIIYKVKDNDLLTKLKEREEQLVSDYEEIVTMLMLLQNTGQSIKKSWEKIVTIYEKKGKKRYAYEEMKLARNKMKSGVMEIEAYREFGKRCGRYEYIKLANILEQNIVIGSNAMKVQLENEVIQARAEKLVITRKKAEECSTKLLIPMVMMLLVVMIILIVPSFLSIEI